MVGDGLLSMRHCVDEAEVAEHVFGLTSSLAPCQTRKKSSWLSVKAAGVVPPSMDPVEKQLFKKRPWLKALVAIPKVQTRYAVGVWKTYPSMKSLLKAKNLGVLVIKNWKQEHEKELLLKDLKLEGLMGDERNLGKVGLKRIFRVMMSTIGDVNTDEVENGPSQIHDLS
ncbi:unnamed protein product [Microthlaspi erraticum]|uniref:Uncharacterized protein n=1 Tax=Microthlaspi erraticum TaxID=1685480 RepID=A0A6D2HMA0_9BRAS|nr:unnamed protein product [Microthlaspi erraticum]